MIPGCQVAPRSNQSFLFASEPKPRFEQLPIWTLKLPAVVTSSLSVTPRFQAGPDSVRRTPGTRTWTRTWTRNLDKFYHVFSSARSCPSSLSKFPGRTWTSGSARGKHVIKLVQVSCPSSCPPPGPQVGIGACLESGQLRELVNTAALSKFLVQVPQANLDKWLCKPCYKLSQYYAPIPAGNSVRLAPAETRTWTRTWTRNLDKFYHVFFSYRATCPSSPGELGQGTWTTAGCRATSSLSITPRFQAGPDSNFVA